MRTVLKAVWVVCTLVLCLLYVGVIRITPSPADFIRGSGGGASHTDYTSQMTFIYHFEEASTPWDNAEGTASRDLTWGNSPTQSTDEFEGTYAAGFAGTGFQNGNFTPASGDIQYDYADDWTIACWVKVTNQTQDGAIFGLGSYDDDLSIALSYDTTNDAFQAEYTLIGYGAPTSIISTHGAVGAGYYFVGMQYDDTNDFMRIFVGDATTAITIDSTAASTDPFLNTSDVMYFGLSQNVAWEQLAGTLDGCWGAKVAFSEAQLNEIRQYGIDGNGW